MWGWSWSSSVVCIVRQVPVQHSSTLIETCLIFSDVARNSKVAMSCTARLTCSARSATCAVVQEPPSTKQEVLELLEALLDLHRRHSNAPISPDLSAQWRAALPPLLAGYGASLGACDRAALRVLLLLDAGLREPEQARGGQDGEEPEQAAEVAARLSGPLARAGCVQRLMRKARWEAPPAWDHIVRAIRTRKLIFLRLT